MQNLTELEDVLANDFNGEKLKEYLGTIDMAVLNIQQSNVKDEHVMLINKGKINSCIYVSEILKKVWGFYHVQS